MSTLGANSQRSVMSLLSILAVTIAVYATRF